MFVLRKLMGFGKEEKTSSIIELENGSLVCLKKDNREEVFAQCTLAIERVDEFSFDLVVTGEGTEKRFKVLQEMNFVRSKDEFECFIWTADDLQWEYVSLEQEGLEAFHLVFAQCLWETLNEKAIKEASDEQIKKLVIFKEKKNTIFTSDIALFYAFDAAKNTFVPIDQGQPVRAFLAFNDEKYYLSVKAGTQVLHEQEVDVDATLHTDRNSFSFIWCHVIEEQTWTFSLRFTCAASVMALSNAIGMVIYEMLNKAKLDDEDKEYFLSSWATPMQLDGTSDDGESEPESDLENGENSDSDYSSDEEEKKNRLKREVAGSKTAKNKKLLVGYKHDRSFVVKGDNSMSIYKHTDDDSLQMITDIQSIKGVKGKQVIRPSKMMLHEEDRSLLMLDEDNSSSIYKMDVEYGKVVEEWSTGNDITCLLPNSKYSQLTNENTLIGLNENSLFRIDPRLAGANKKVEAESKSYVVKNAFSCGATTGAGHLAIGSAKGDIRLYDKLDKRAKTLLPGFGDAITAVDVTENGKLLVATCKTYLLLISTQVEDVNAFTKTLAKNKRSAPIRLQLRPEHVAHLGAKNIAFTPAKFSTGTSEERAIITSTGPYVITWNLRRVKQGKVHEYQIRRYEHEVVADDFRYGNDRSIVVTLPHRVTIISKNSLSKKDTHHQYEAFDDDNKNNIDQISDKIKRL